MKLRDVIAKYERIADNLDDIVKTAHHEAFADFSLELKTVARRALSGVDGIDSERLDRWIDTFVAKNAGAVMHFTLSPDSNRSSIDAFLVDEPESLGIGPAGVSEADIERWVLAGAERGSSDDYDGKVFDGRDQDVDSTVRKMQGILMSKYAGGDIGRVQEKYGDIIKEFLLREGGGMENEGFNSLAAIIVLEAWVSHIRTRWPQYVLTELRRQVRS